MSSPYRTSQSLRAGRRSSITAAGPRRPGMSEQQLAAYLAARDAVRRANRISLASYAYTDSRVTRANANASA